MLTRKTFCSIALTLSLTLPALLVSESALASENTSASVNLGKRLQALTALQADFTQTSQTAGKPASVVLGSLAVQKPGLFRWEVRSPYQQLIVSDGKAVRTFDPDLQQMTVKAVTKEWSQTPALLFGGDIRQLQQEFVITEKKVGGLIEYQLLPKAKDALFASLSLQFKGNEPYAMNLKDSLGQTTQILFFKIHLNSRQSNTQFTIVPPAGTDVIRE